MAKRNSEPEEGVRESKRRLTIVFDGKYAELYDVIHNLASSEDRDPDSVVLRCLHANLKQAE